jgi:hypothetical protein
LVPVGAWNAWNTNLQIAPLSDSERETVREREREREREIQARTKVS